MLALVHNGGPRADTLSGLINRRLLALLTVAWEHNRRLSLRLIDYADQFRQRGLACNTEGWHTTVSQVQLLASFARVRARELQNLLRARGGWLTVRLPADELFLSIKQELPKIAALGRVYGSALDIALHLLQDLELVERLQHHVDELAELVRQLGALEQS